MCAQNDLGMAGGLYLRSEADDYVLRVKEHGFSDVDRIYRPRLSPDPIIFCRIARFARPPQHATLYVSLMKRRWVFRAARWAGRVIGVTLVVAVAWLCLRWTQAHWWLQALLTLWSLTFIPAGWVGGSMIAHWIVRRTCRAGSNRRASL